MIKIALLASIFICPQEKVTWVRDFETACKQAAASGRPILCHLAVPVLTGDEKPPTGGGGG